VTASAPDSQVLPPLALHDFLQRFQYPHRITVGFRVYETQIVVVKNPQPRVMQMLLYLTRQVEVHSLKVWFFTAISMPAAPLQLLRVSSEEV